MKTNKLELQVLVNGKPVQEYEKGAATYIEGRNNTEYSLRVLNHGPRDVVALVSVDGIDVISGKPADGEQGGYIVPRNGSTTIKGFRISDEEVGAFKFVYTDSGKVYAESVDGGKNIGVIGVLAFERKGPTLKDIEKQLKKNREKPSRPSVPWVLPYPVSPPWELPRNPWVTWQGDTGGPMMRSLDFSTTCGSYGANVNCSMMSQVHDGAACSDSTKQWDVGTGWGSKRKDEVRHESFERGKQIGPISLYYASKDSLKRMGVIRKTAKAVSTMPQPFAGVQYATPPAGWEG